MRMLRRMALLVLVMLLGVAAGVLADRTPLARAERTAHVVTERVASRVPGRLKRVFVRVRNRVPERIDRLVDRLASN